ncbi:MAG: site-2 protease family protein [Clostridiales bacterium]|nr:site-2 protease family protein [Clostridiales bacterium]
MKIFSFGGISVKFHWVFILLLFLLAFYGYLAETLILFGLVFAHEIIHMLVARAHGLEVGDVELFPFGGVARIEDVLELDPQVESNVALAGPLFNFTLAALAVIAYANVPSLQQHETFLFFIRCNLVLGFFNLLPALPLDGGRVLRARLAGTMGFQQATELAIRISHLMAFILLAIAVYLFLHEHFHITLFAASFFLFYAASKERTVAMYTFIRSLGRKKKMFVEQGVMPLVTLMALEDAPLKEVLRRFAMKKYHRIVVVSRDGKVLGEALENEVVDTVVYKGIYATMQNVLQRK